MVGRIREHLRLEHDRVALAVQLAGLADDRAVDEIARIELDPRLFGQDLHHAARHRILDPRHQPGCGDRRAAHHPIMIIAAAVAGSAHPAASRTRSLMAVGLRKSNTRPCDLAEFAGRDRGRVGGEYSSAGIVSSWPNAPRAAPSPARFPVGVVGEVHDGRLVGRRLIVDEQVALFIERIGRRSSSACRDSPDRRRG